MGTEDASENKKTSGRIVSRLRQERERRAWTQSKVAECIGTTQINVSRWEKGTTLPGPYYRQKLGELFGKSMEELGLIPESGDEQSVTIWNVPHRRNPFFTGREEILDYLYTVFRSDNAAGATLAISGLGGIGKTQIAIEYAYSYRDHYQATFWINASAREALSADFVLLAVLLNLPEQYEQDRDIVMRAVKRWLASHHHWLLILDNVDNLEMIVDFLPIQSTGDVLITTRLQALGTLAQSIEIEKMDQNEGVLFLLRRTRLLTPGASLERANQEHYAQAVEIVTALEGLPLALDQAGAYIEETRCGLSQYLNLYGTRRKELLLRRGAFSLDHPDSVVATWALSFQQIEQESQAAADLLHLLAFLDPEAIPEEIIMLGAKELGLALGEVASDPFKIDQIIELLLRYSLIRRIPELKSLRIHRLVQAVLKDGMDKETKHMWGERAIRAVNCAFPNVELETWERCQRCLPHVQICTRYVEEYGLTFPEAARLLNEAALYLIARAGYEQAESLLLICLLVRQQELEANHPDTACTLNDLGTLYFNQGKYEKAVPSLKEALLIRQTILGENHPDVAQTLNNLANVYRAQGAYMEAEPLYLQALHIRKTTLGVDHLLVALSYYSLAKLYHSQERYQQAEKLCKQALHIRKQHLGNNHPLIASTLNMLAKIYQGQKKLDQAKEMHMCALQMQESTSGADHPHVAATINNLVEIFHAEGRYREAEPMIARALRIHEQSLGSEHPYLAYSLSNQAENFFLRENYTQAELYYKKAQAIREQHLGFHHPRTASTYYRLAQLYSTLERYEEAERFYHKALTIREQIFGTKHPAVTRIQEQYGALLRKQKRESEAREFERHTRQSE
jgi:tetratricopeptide (TPR) repeat protein/transcriptional regulator with XRE-family HTH domain